MIKETNLARANAYYRVTAPFHCIIRRGCAESQTYVGRSMVLMHVYERIVAQRGDEVHHLYGGIFLHRAAEKRCYAVEIEPLGDHPFLKQYLPPQEDWPLDKLEQLEPHEAVRYQRQEAMKTLSPREISAQGWFASW